jgi:hypothetical protein
VDYQKRFLVFLCTPHSRAAYIRKSLPSEEAAPQAAQGPPLWPLYALLSLSHSGLGLIPHRSRSSFNCLLRLAASSTASSAVDIPESVSRYSPCAVRLGLG